MLPDRRAIKRTRVLRSAQIIVPRLSPLVHCMVCDLGGGGACLQLADTAGLPETFNLTFDRCRTRRPCRVVWRSADRLGVRFENAGSAATV